MYEQFKHSNYNALWNIDNVVSMSSDMCFFYPPTFNLSGGGKANMTVNTQYYSGISVNNIVSGITNSVLTNNSIPLSCVTSSELVTQFINNGSVIYSGIIATYTATTALTASSLTAKDITDAIQGGYDANGWIYTRVNDTSLKLTKPYSVNVLDIKLCMNYEVDTACAFTAATTNPLLTGGCSTILTNNFGIATSADTNVFILTGDTIPLTFNFTGHVDTFSAKTAEFKYEVYKFNKKTNVFDLPAVYTAGTYSYDDVKYTSAITQTLTASTIGVDGDFLVKGYYTAPYCTNFLGGMGVINDTSENKLGAYYNLYDPNLDYYFSAFNKADTPQFQNGGNDIPLGILNSIGFLATGQTSFSLPAGYQNSVIVNLNGLTLSETYDYTVNYTGGTITLNEPTVSGDVVSFVYITGDNFGSGFTQESIVVNSIPSGTTNNQGSNNIYYNTTTGKYEVYTNLTPSSSNDILINLNGASLANGVDYYQSISNAKRIILTGIILTGDIINISYISTPQIIGNTFSNTPTISWTINNKPIESDSIFTIEVSTGTSFTTLSSTASTYYEIGRTSYSLAITISGNFGETLYYRVKNDKKYKNLVGDFIHSISYSDTVPITISTNAINSY